jgi:membrane associated rhomboid family serine protease
MPPVTLNLIIANVAVFLLETGGMVSPDGPFALWPPASGPLGSNFELWQLVTYSFLHGNVPHIFFNMFALYMFGSDVERLFGSRFFTAYYFVSVLAARSATSWSPPGWAPNPCHCRRLGRHLACSSPMACITPPPGMLLKPPIPMSARMLVVVYAVLSGPRRHQHRRRRRPLRYLGGMLGAIMIRYRRGFRS